MSLKQLPRCSNISENQVREMQRIGRGHGGHFGAVRGDVIVNLPNQPTGEGVSFPYLPGAGEDRYQSHATGRIRPVAKLNLL